MAFPEAIRLERGLSLMLVVDHLAQVLRVHLARRQCWWQLEGMHVSSSSRLACLTSVANERACIFFIM